jgi:hypothetical protein
VAGSGVLQGGQIHMAFSESKALLLNTPEAALQPYLPLIEAQRGSNVDSVSFLPSSVVGYSALDGVTEPSRVALVQDSLGSFTLSLNPIPGHSPYAVLRTATSAGTTTWIVDTATATVVTSDSTYFSSGPVVTDVAPVTSSISLTAAPADAVREATQPG